MPPQLFDEFADKFVMFHPSCPPAVAQHFPDRGRYGRYIRCVDHGVDGPQRWECELGMLLSQEEFLIKALTVEHPFNSCSLMHEFTQNAIDAHVKMGIDGIRRWRVEQLAKYRTRANELQLEEDRLHERLHEGVASVITDKRILVFQEMLRDAGSPDTAFAEQIVKGLPLLGPLPFSGYFGRSLCFASLSVAQLEQMAPSLRAVVVANMGPMGDTDLDEQIASGTDEEMRR
eukprot:762289-Amphidinium_carterae.1